MTADQRVMAMIALIGFRKMHAELVKKMSLIEALVRGMETGRGIEPQEEEKTQCQHG